MNVTEAIEKRRSVRSYLYKEVPEETIKKIIRAGTWAPSAHHRQPWSFVALTNKNKIEELSKHISGVMKKDDPAHKLRDVDDPIFYGAPVVVIVCGRADNKWSMIDCSMVAENMALAATELGLGTCFIGRIKHAEQDVLESLGMKKGYEPVVAMVLGHIKEKQTPKQREQPDIAWVR